MKEALVRLAYTPREAAFLEVASLLSGYFLRRQFNEFIGGQCGAVAQKLIQRGTALGHFKPIPVMGGRVLYHIAESSLYAHLGDPKNRNRREHQPDTIRARLMALDFAIARPKANWLLTEHAKAKYFLERGISASDLPHVAVQGKPKRYFAEKQPISRDAGGSPQFAFIDAGLRTFSQWELFLRSHRVLLQQIQAGELVFASCRASRFTSAENTFRRIVASETTSGGLDAERLKGYFIARRAFEEKRYGEFDQGRLDELRENKQVFTGEQFEARYRRWHDRGDFTVDGLRALQISLRFQALPQMYEWLSPI